MIPKISTSFTRGREGDLVNLTYNVTNCIHGNLLFPNPPEALPTAEKLLPEFQQALLDASGRDRRMSAIKNAKRDQLRWALKDLANYVTDVANGDKNILLASGFILTGMSQTKVMLPISNLQVVTDTSGEATTRVKRVAGARAYMHQYTTSIPTDDTAWITEGSDAPEHTFTRLSSGVKYWFRVVAIGKQRQVVSSPLVSRFIQ